MTEEQPPQPQDPGTPPPPPQQSPPWYQQPAPSPGWQAPPPGYQPYPPAPRTNGYAIAALVCGIAGFVTCCVGWALALVFGYQARDQIDKSNGAETGREMAQAGIILGWVGLGLCVVGVVVWLLVAVAATSSSS